LERDAREERRQDAERVDRRADVVVEAGEGELLGLRPAADRLLRLDDEDRVPGTRDLDRGGEPVRSCPDDDRLDHPATIRRTRARTQSVNVPQASHVGEALDDAVYEPVLLRVSCAHPE